MTFLDVLNKHGMRSILLLILFIAPMAQGQTVGDLFKSMPTELIPGLSEGDKTMLLVDTGQTTVPYMLGEVKKTKHTCDHLSVQTSEIGTTELKLLPVTPDSVIVGVINTVCGGACDSRISFYTTGWEKMEDSTLLPAINGELFFDSSQKERENYKYAVSLPGIYPISATFKDNETDLLLTFNYKDHLTNEQVEEISPFIKSDSITLTWNGTSFK